MKVTRRLRYAGCLAALATASCVGAGTDPVGVGAPAAPRAPTPTEASPTVTTARPSPSVTPSASPTPKPAEEAVTPPKRPPDRWVGVQDDGEHVMVVLSRAGRARTRLARWPTTDPYGELRGSKVATDIALAPLQDAVLVALCCEPVPGTIWQVGLSADRRDPKPVGSGDRVDVSGATQASADVYGYLYVQPFVARDSRSKSFSSRKWAFDVTVQPGGRRTAALIDPERVIECCLDAPPGPAGVLVVTHQQAGRWNERFWPLSGRYCAAVGLNSGRVALLRGRGTAQCTGDRLDVLNPDTGKVKKNLLQLPSRVHHLSIDESGTYFIYTDASGAVRWTTTDGRAGKLADGGFTKADW